MTGGPSSDGGLLLGGLALDRLHLGEAEQVGQLLVVMRGFLRRVFPGLLGGLDRGLAGLAGVTYYLGYFGSIQPKVLVSTGFDAIAVSLLGNSNPIGILFSSFLITIISKGSTYMSSAAGIQAEIASVITGILLLFSACGAYMKQKIKLLEYDITAEKSVLQKQEKGEEQ